MQMYCPVCGKAVTVKIGTINLFGGSVITFVCPDCDTVLNVAAKPK